MRSPAVRVAFVCVQNAGRSQMATAFAEQERRKRGLETEVALLTGGTQPADHVHDTVVEAMDEVEVDLTERTPQTITPDDVEKADLVITMGCAAADVCPATWSGENREWPLDDPDGKTLQAVREIRSEVRRRVRDLFDELEQAVNQRV